MYSEAGYSPPEHETKQEHKQQEISAKLAEFGVEYSRHESLEENKNRFFILRGLRDHGMLEVQNGLPIFDVEKIKTAEFGNNHIGLGRGSAGTWEILKALRGLKDFRTNPPSELVVFPETIDELTLMGSGGYAAKVAKAEIKPWELGREINWDRKIQLESGDVVNRAELTMASLLLGDLRARRSPENGDLEIFDPEQGSYISFSARAFHKITGIKFSAQIEGKKTTFEANPLLYAKIMLPHLFQKGLLRDSDFGTIRGSETSKVFGRNELNFGGSNPYVVMQSGNYSARYNLGRNNTADVRAIQLDPGLAGIITKVHGRRILKSTFNLLTQEEIEVKRGQAEKKFKINNPGQEPTFSQITSRITIGPDEFAKQDYSATNFINRRADDTPESYAKRLENISDIDFVMQTCRGIFSDAGIGIHNLLWKEQLLLTAAVLEEPNRERLVNFAKRFGLDGLKALTASEYNIGHVQKVLAWAERQPGYAQRVFEQYAKVGQSVRALAEHVKLPETPDIHAEIAARFPVEFEEAVMRRNQDLLMAADVIAENKKITPEQHVGVFQTAEKSLAMVSELFGNSKRFEFQAVGRESGRNNINFKVTEGQTGFEYKLKFFVRPEATPHGQARINIMVDFNTSHPDGVAKELFEQNSFYKKQKKMRSESVLRIGIDLETKTDPPTISLDLGRNEIHDAEIERTGDMLAKILSLSQAAGSHTQDSFSKNYAPYFKYLAEGFLRALEQKAEQPHARVA